jgi:hypothetical protein
MDVCGTVEQRKEIIFRAFDSRQRGNATVTALVHLGDEQRDLPVRQVEPFLYEFGFSHTERGIAILEVYFDGIQIPESPFQVRVQARDCDADFPGQSRIPVSACVQLKFTSDLNLSLSRFELFRMPSVDVNAQLGLSK